MILIERKPDYPLHLPGWLVMTPDPTPSPPPPPEWLLMTPDLTPLLISFRLEKDVTKAWEWVPLTGMPNSLPASTLLVPSKPEHSRRGTMHRYIAIHIAILFCIITILFFSSFVQCFSFRQKRYIIISTCDFCKVIPQIHNYFMKIFCENILWKYFMKIFYENILWKYFMKIFYENILWKYFMKIFFLNTIRSF